MKLKVVFRRGERVSQHFEIDSDYVPQRGQRMLIEERSEATWYEVTNVFLYCDRSSYGHRTYPVVELDEDSKSREERLSVEFRVATTD